MGDSNFGFSTCHSNFAIRITKPLPWVGLVALKGYADRR